MLTLEEARAVIASHLHTLPPLRVPLQEALGRVLRESFASPEDLPGFDRSAFDGYACHATETPGVSRVVFEIAAGAVPSRTLAPGECARIFTGAQIPEGADTVAMQEQTERAGDEVKIPAIESGQGVRKRGEDARMGDVLLPRGQRLGPVELSLLAQLGHTHPLVGATARILHIVTGSELVAATDTPQAGQIRDSNSTLVAALAAEAGTELVGQSRAGDDLNTLMEAIHATPHDAWDLLLISGGASVGDYDFGARALAESGFSIHFRALNLRPGKPLIFATRGRQAAFVLPGNPLSHVVCWHVAVRMAIEFLQTSEWIPSFVRIPLAGEKPLRGNPRETYWPARMEWTDAGPTARPLHWQSSGDLTALAGMDLLVRVPAGASNLHPGDTVEALRLEGGY